MELGYVGTPKTWPLSRSNSSTCITSNSDRIALSCISAIPEDPKNLHYWVGEVLRMFVKSPSKFLEFHYHKRVCLLLALTVSVSLINDMAIN